MSISYKFAKLNSRVIENSQNFKNYFSKKRFNKFTGLMGGQIVKILVLKDEERSESPRVCQRLNNLRNWNYEKIKSLYIRIS